MKFNNLLELILNMDGKHYRKTGGVYMSLVDIEKFPALIQMCDDIQSILITPFLINTKIDALYELHYYEFEIEISNILQSHYLEYPQGNVLPKEIVENIKPKAIVSQSDKIFFVNALSSYFTAMRKMTFESDKLSNSVLNDANLYFQIY